MAMGLHSSWNGDERFEEWDLRLRERVEGIMYFYKWWVAAQFITVHLSLPHDKEIPGMAQKPECWGLAKKKKKKEVSSNKKLSNTMTSTLRSHKVAILKINQQNMVARGMLVLVPCREGAREDAKLQGLSRCLLEQLKMLVIEDL